jgi:SAM-dependent methyltransferase
MLDWRVKIAAKIVLSRLPFGYVVWQGLGLFRLGRMDNVDYALKIFQRHAGRAWPDGLPPDFVALEMGPGDSIATALIACAYGARKTYLADVGAFANRDVGLYRRIARDLRARGVAAPDIEDARTFEEVLERCRAEYITDGLGGLRALPAASVDFSWSHSVLEHVRRADFEETMRELRRVMKPGGRSSHNVDLQDHLDHALNNLRFSERVWESEFFASSGFYTNRIRYAEMLDMVRRAGFVVTQTDAGRWDNLPTPREKLVEPYRSLPLDDLLVRVMSLTATPAT